MRSAALLQGHSAVNAELYRLTLPNHAQYCDKHDYDMLQYNLPYADAVKFDVTMDLVTHAFEHNEYVFTLGSDVVITDMARPLQTFADPGYGIIVAEQGFGNSFINADTILWQRGSRCVAAMALIMTLQAKWESDPMTMQGALCELFAEQRTAGLIKAVPGRVMQSSAYRSPTAWRPGDFAIHYFGDTNAGKFKRIEQFIRTGVVSWC